ncbi:HAMP domain-containing sensor histidine kinase [Methanolobus sp. WCC4]|uniref:sensor histidine kinase n=1 Tax=Methanolobus sp. WCC4 TaxID=3125784 RepID=UPI0030F99B94
MDLKQLNSRKETINKRITFDAVLILTGMAFVSFLLFLGGNTGILDSIRIPFKEWILSGLSIIIILLMISSWIFSFRRYRDTIYALEEFSSIDAMKEDFISNLRHELKTPLVPIKGYSELICDGTLGDTTQKQKDALKKINASSEKLERIIDSLIFISAAKYGETDYTFTSLRIEDLIMGASSEISGQLEQKGQRLDTDIRHGLPFIEGDRKYLKEVILQVLENASKFSPPDTTILIVAHEGYKNLHIKIIDNGIGIPEDEIDNIFQRFYQVDGSKTRRYGGNGLGLHIAKTIVEAHKGNIWIESTLEKGTNVHIRLPVPEYGKKK